MTRTIRRISQILFFGLFLYLIAITAYPLKPWPAVDIFARLNPLVAGATMIAARTIIPAMLLSLAIVGITLLLGRVFCGWMCPLGTTLDISDKLFYRGKKSKQTASYRPLKYYILAGVFVSSIFTMQLVYLLDPISLLTRTIVVGFVAPIQLALQWLLEITYGWSFSAFGPLSSTGIFLSDRLSQATGIQFYFRQAFLILAIFVAIIGLNSISRRFWCRNLCPMGALLGLLSHVPILKRGVSEDCSDCSKCARDCKMDAIPENPRLTRYTECVECFDCAVVCPAKSVKFGVRPKPDLRPETKLDLPRRRVLQGAGVGFAAAAMLAIDPGRKRAIGGTSPIKLSSQFLIRPPGAMEENQFLARCTRCGLCMKVCPTNGLQPAVHEAGIEGFWSPILVPKIGACTEMCNACGEVCPTNAIEPFEIEEKNHIFIGTAVIEREHCIAWYADKQCLVCDEYCSYKAIEWREIEGYQRPFVDEHKCVGCGLCEFACPVQPDAAIRIFSRGDKRHMTREEQMIWSETIESDNDFGDESLPY